ncbi:MAG: prepilin-type N-terminal cleavage/methylation domain-containing protein [Fimbriimonadaceae bacterium]
MQLGTGKAQRRAFTLVELLIVIIIIAVLAAIAIPRFVNSSERSKEAALHGDLKLVRDAIERFNNDTGTYPATLDALVASAPPNSGLNTSGGSAPIHTTDWRGPYLATIPSDPVSGSQLTYSEDPTDIGQVRSSAQGDDSTGTPFRSY